MMRTLRVLVSTPPTTDSVHAWALFDTAGRMLEHGGDRSAQWPQAERREAVIGADAVRIVALDLPPLPKSRVAAAATYALEDRLATSGDDAVVVIGPRQAEGHVIAIVVSRELVRALAGASPGFSRAIAEPQLAQPVDGWRWCESATSAFVRTADGGAFSVSRDCDAALPPELVLALDQATRERRPPSRVVVDRACDTALLDHWRHETGVAFVAGTAWRWEDAKPAASAAATDVLAASRRASSAPAAMQSRSFSVALALAGIAIGAHVIATIGTWLWQRASLARTSQAIVSLAHDAGARNATASDATTLIALLYADARHRAGLHAPTDAMPVLARAAPALASLPTGALRTANWTAGAWTLELGPLDDAALSALAERISGTGLTALHAKTERGVRMRVTSPP